MSKNTKVKQEKHRKNMFKEMSIKAKLTANLVAHPEIVANVLKATSEKTARRVADKVAKATGVTADRTATNLKRYCIAVLSFIGAAKLDPTGMALNNIRNNILTNLPGDIKKALADGETKEQCFHFYWDVPEFQQMWGKLGWDEEFLRNMIE